MKIQEKLTGPLGVMRAIDNIAGHIDEDSRVRLAALDRIIAHAQAAKVQIEEATQDEVLQALGASSESED